MRRFRSSALVLFLLSSPAVVVSQTAITNNPYTATFKTTVRKPENGSIITRETTMKQARDSQGRTMVQDQMYNPNTFSTVATDPTTHTTTSWNTETKIASRIHVTPPHSDVVQPSASSDSEMVVGVAISGAPSGWALVNLSSTDPNNPPSQMEKLGSQMIAGVYAEGIRITVTFPVGYLRNDKPIINVYERWTAPDLKLVVLSIVQDPRSGTKTTELTNLDRSEPDPSLFQPPQDYTIEDRTPKAH